MSKFKVGDIIKGNVLSDKRYGFTNSKMTKGEVVSIIGEQIRIRILEHKYLSYIGGTHSVLEEYFDLVEVNLNIEYKETSQGTFITINDKYTVFTTAKKDEISVVKVSDIKQDLTTAKFLALANVKQSK